MKTKIEKLEDEDISKVPWKNLSFEDRKNRCRATFAVMLIRNKNSINSSASMSELKPEEVIFHAKQAFERKNGEWCVKEKDDIERLVFFYENRRLVPIVVRNSSDDKFIHDWYNAICNYTDYPDINYIAPFKDKFIEDVYGVKHPLWASILEMYHITEILLDYLQGWVIWDGYEDIFKI